MAERVLVLGGTRSGKSAVAEGLVVDAEAVTYVATGRASDAELAARIAAHRERRPEGWRTLETTALDDAMAAAPGGAVLIDNLAGWLAERMTALRLWPTAVGVDLAPPTAASRAGTGQILEEACRWWRTAADHPGGPVVLVADESGLGVVPADPASRRWLDLAGDVVQALAAEADRVLLVLAGRVLELPPGGGAVSTAAPAPGTAAGGNGRSGRAGSPAGEPGRVAAGDDRAAAPATAAVQPVALRAHGDTMVPDNAIDFAVNVHGAGPPNHIRAALRRADDRLGSYPDPAPTRAVVAARHGRSPREVLLTAGAAEALWLVGQRARGKRAAVVHPQFTEPEAALRAARADIVHVLRRPEDGWRLDPEAVPDDADIVVIGNPNNPTGTLDDAEVIADLCRSGRLVVVDEAFMDFVVDPTASLAARRDLPGLVVVRSVTKLWALPGVRAGYLVAGADLVADLDDARQPWPLGAQALLALEACCADDSHRVRVATEVQIARDRFADALRGLDGVQVWPGAANYLLLRVPDGPSVHRRLLDRRIAVRPSTFPGLSADHLRVTVRDQADNDAFVAALRDVLAAA